MITPRKTLFICKYINSKQLLNNKYSNLDYDFLIDNDGKILKIRVSKFRDLE